MQDNQETIELFENQCCVCFVPFWQKRRGRLRRTCSRACRQKLYRMRRGDARPTAAASEVPEEQRRVYGKRMPRIGTVCPVCQKPLEQPATGRKRSTCSERCRKRLWRWQHPRCLACGKRFVMAKWQKEQKYCSDRCRERAFKAQQRQRAREKAWAEAAGYRPEWMPRQGSGYREEIVPWESDEKAAVTRASKANPNRLPEGFKDEEEWAESGYARSPRVEPPAEAASPPVPPAPKPRDMKRYWHDLLVDESKWRDL